MKPELLDRTKAFALRIIALVDALPATPTGRVIGNQILRSGTSVGANYRSCQRGKSRADFIAKLAIAEEEADESVYWLELLVESSILPQERLLPLLTEAREITAILTASRIRAKQNSEKEGEGKRKK